MKPRYPEFHPMPKYAIIAAGIVIPIIDGCKFIIKCMNFAMHMCRL